MSVRRQYVLLTTTAFFTKTVNFIPNFPDSDVSLQSACSDAVPCMVSNCLVLTLRMSLNRVSAQGEIIAFTGCC